MTDTVLDDSGALDDAASEILVTALRAAAGSASGAALDRALDEIGWVDALDVAPRVAVASLFDQQGRSGSTSGALGRLLADTIGAPSATGSVTLLPAFGSAAPTATGDTVLGLATQDVLAAEQVLVTALHGESPKWHAVPVAQLHLRPVEGLDPRFGLVEVTGPILAGTEVAGWSPAAHAWDDVVAICRRAVGHELVGAMRTMLELARSHALDRVQFDRAIAGFQAVRHRLAESLVAIEAAEAALGGAWEDGSPLASALAKAVCGESARTVRRHCQQVLAGIGFTSEHDLHLYVRRTLVLDGLFGDARTITAEVGAGVLTTGEVPGLLPL